MSDTLKLVGVLMSPSRFYGRGLGLKSGYVVQIFESCVRHIQFQAVLFRFVNTPTPGNTFNVTTSRVVGSHLNFI